MTGLRCLLDFHLAGLDTIAECKNCGRRVRAEPKALLDGIKVKWRRNLEYEGSKLRCTACNHRGARLAPAPKDVSTVDCRELQADIQRMWERVMSEHEFNSEDDRAEAAAKLRAAADVLDDGFHTSLVEQLRSIADDMEMIGQ